MQAVLRFTAVTNATEKERGGEEILRKFQVIGKLLMACSGWGSIGVGSGGGALVFIAELSLLCAINAFLRHCHHLTLFLCLSPRAAWGLANGEGRER